MLSYEAGPELEAGLCSLCIMSLSSTPCKEMVALVSGCRVQGAAGWTARVLAARISAGMPFCSSRDAQLETEIEEQGAGNTQ